MAVDQVLDPVTAASREQVIGEPHHGRDQAIPGQPFEVVGHLGVEQLPCQGLCSRRGLGHVVTVRDHSEAGSRIFTLRALR